MTGLLSRGFPRSQQPSFPTVTSCSDRPSASETARGEHTVKSHLVLLSSFSLFSFHSSSLINFGRISNLIVKPNTLSCLWMLLSLRTIQREAVLKSTSPFKSYSWSFSKASLESWAQNIGVVQPPLARATYLSLEFHPKTSLPMARCPKSGKLSRFAFGPVAVPSSVALARFGGSQAHRDHLQPPKIFSFSKNTYTFIPSGLRCF